VIGMLMGPAALLIGLAGMAMGASALLFLLFVIATVAFCASLLCASLRATASVNGVFLLLLIAHAGLVFALPAPAYAAFALIGVAASRALILRSLARFCDASERTSLDSIA